MNSRGRLGVLMVSVPVLAFAVVGGFMGKAMARQESLLSTFASSRTWSADRQQLRRGSEGRQGDARRDARSGRRPRSRQRVSRRRSGQGFEKNETCAARVSTGLELTRQYYLRVIAARDGSPAARAGLRPGDYIRAIDGQSTRDTSVYRRHAAARRQARHQSDARGAARQRRRAASRSSSCARSCRPRQSEAGWRAPKASATCASRSSARRRPIRSAPKSPSLTKGGAPRLVLDLRGTAFGDVESGLAAARLFVPTARWVSGRSAAKRKKPCRRAAGDGSITLPRRAPHRQRHVGPGGALRGRAHRQQARVALRRAHARPRRASASRAPARRQRAAAHAPALPDAGRSRDQREGPDARCRRRTARRRVRPARADGGPDARQSDRAPEEQVGLVAQRVASCHSTPRRSR